MARLVDIDDTSLLERRIGALPIVNRILSRLGLEALFDDYVPADPRATLAPSASLLVVVRNLVIERARLQDHRVGCRPSRSTARARPRRERHVER